MSEPIPYRGVDAAGRVCQGTVSAADEQTARLLLLQQGIQVLELGASVGGAESSARQSGSLKGADVLWFTRELSQLKRANLPLERALTMLHDLAGHDRLRRMVREVAQSIRAGKSLYAALLPFEAALGRRYLAVIRAGEASGNLQAALADLTQQLEADAQQRSQLITALTYPAILLGVSVVSVLLLLLFVVPQFRELFDTMGDALPMTTRWVLAFSDGARLYWREAMLVGVLALWALQRWYRSPNGRLALDAMLLKLPVWGDVVVALQSAVYHRTLGMLLQRGVPLPDALLHAAQTVTNRAMAQQAAPLVEHVKAGRPLSEGLATTALGGRGAAALLRIAEETGQLAPTLLSIGLRFEDEGRRVLQRLLALVEPLIIIGLGTIVAFIIVAILGGVLSINETI